MGCGRVGGRGGEGVDWRRVPRKASHSTLSRTCPLHHRPASPELQPSLPVNHPGDNTLQHSDCRPIKSENKQPLTTGLDQVKAENWARPGESRQLG